MSDFTTKEAMALLDISAPSIRKLIRDHKLKAEKRGRDWFISKDEVDRYNRERTGRGMTGKKHSAETKEKMRQARLKNPTLTPETRKNFRFTQNHSSGSQARGWKGGRFIKRGYVIIYAPDHPHAVRRYMYEHRLVAEQNLGRYLTDDEIVHHINGITTDNRPENLQIMTRSEHCQFHQPHLT